MWFRIELHKDGSVASCTEVEGSFSGSGKSVHYVEADTKAAAIQILADKYKKRRAAEKTRRQDKRAAGICVNCPASTDGGPLCVACRLKHRAANRDLYRRKCKGENVVAPTRYTTDEQRALRAQLDAERARIRARDHARRTGETGYSRTLRRVLSHFDSMSPKAFRAWLVDSLERSIATSRKAMVQGSSESRPRALAAER
jgi:hypothetical protein